jgi:hypothetical protein
MKPLLTASQTGLALLCPGSIRMRTEAIEARALPEPTPEQSRGTAVHAAIEARCPDRLDNSADAEAVRWALETTQALVNDAIAGALEREARVYFRKSPQGIALSYDASDEDVFSARPDLWCRTPNGIKIIDYKTGRSDDPLFSWFARAQIVAMSAFWAAATLQPAIGYLLYVDERQVWESPPVHPAEAELIVGRILAAACRTDWFQPGHWCQACPGRHICEHRAAVIQAVPPQSELPAQPAKAYAKLLFIRRVIEDMLEQLRPAVADAAEEELAQAGLKRIKRSRVELGRPTPEFLARLSLLYEQDWTSAISVSMPALRALFRKEHNAPDLAIAQLAEQTGVEVRISESDGIELDRRIRLPIVHLMKE